MIDTAAKKISVYIKNQVPHHPSSIAVLETSIGLFLNVASIVLITLLGSLVTLVTGNLKEVIILLISFPLLRRFSGGFHLKSGTSCALYTSALFTLLSFIDLTEIVIIHSLTFLALLIVLIYAPSNFENQRNVPEKYYPLLRVVSALLVSINFFIVSDTLAISFLTQAFSLILGKEVRIPWK
ncbi:accessory gene regulator B family protein [Paenibacillus sp. 453mf]|uniref:accessory gene regulator ArgB-like protein n=1 Tax=Paenibacillus sp. 453mf TaxID=1761874 RepID=UPI0008E9E7EB|nr:accessory gene regulator B family protein [Paenibacillus sp. 453mf]SFS61007.1 accessory gene regulator B [Paenibacillus sp. 453mf]